MLEYNPENLRESAQVRGARGRVFYPCKVLCKIKFFLSVTIIKYR